MVAGLKTPFEILVSRRGPYNLIPVFLQQTKVEALLAHCEGNPPVNGGFPSQRASDAGFDVSLNKRLNKHSGCRGFETPWQSLWRQCKQNIVSYVARNYSFANIHENMIISYNIIIIIYKLLYVWPIDFDVGRILSCIGYSIQCVADNCHLDIWGSKSYIADNQQLRGRCKEITIPYEVDVVENKSTVTLRHFAQANHSVHDDMETFFALLTICVGNQSVTGGSPSQWARNA